jgi:DNA-binding SARP family transcriptional activator
MSIPEGSRTGTGTFLHVLKGPFVTVEGERRDIPDSCQRLMVWLSLRRSRVDRIVAAGVLWPVVDDRRAAGNLRSALWRLRGAGLELVDSNNTSLALRVDVTVDVHMAADWAQRVICGSARDGDMKVVPWLADAIDLLSGWDDDWAILERERLRHRMLHAFEQLSRLFTDAGRHAEAVRAARAVVVADPLRESAQFALIEAYVAAGDIAESRRALDTYSQLHRRTFGVDPSTRLIELTSSPHARTANRSSPGRLASGQQ